MGIRPWDIGGNIFIFFDPSHETDRYHADKITSLSGNCAIIYAFMMGHQITDIMAGSNNLNELITACRQQDRNVLLRLVNRVRRNNQASLRTLLNRAIVRHPVSAARASLVERSPLRHDPEPFENVILPILKSLIDFKRFAAAQLYAAEVSRVVLLNYENEARMKLVIKNKRGDKMGDGNICDAIIQTWHGTQVVYDLTLRRLRHVSSEEFEEQKIDLLPVFLRENLENCVLVVVDCDEDYGLKLYKNGEASLVSIDDAMKLPFIEILPSPFETHQACALRLEGNYVCAESDGNITANREVPLHWETFILHQNRRVKLREHEKNLIAQIADNNDVRIEINMLTQEANKFIENNEISTAVTVQNKILNLLKNILIDSELYENLLYQSFRIFNATMIEFLARKKNEYELLTVEFNSSVGANPSVVQCIITPDRQCHFVFSPSLTDVGTHYAPVLQLITWHWANTLPIICAYAKGNWAAGRVLISLGDEAHVPGLSFCDRAENSTLIPDPYFIKSRGYRELRRKFREKERPWLERLPVALWRGSTTGYRVTENVFDLPRVRLCLYAQNHSDIVDAGITSFVQLVNIDEEEAIKSCGILKEYVPPQDFANWQYQIDIDGNTNSWPGLFSKLLSNSVVLKVASELGWRQWYYDRMEPYRHYFPIKADFSDLAPAIRYLRSNPEYALKLAAAGRSFATSLSYETEIDLACKNIEITILSYKNVN